MNSLHWQRLEDVFHAVVDLPPGAARDTQVTTLCGGNHALADEVRALLAEDDRLKVDAAEDPHPGLRLGSYHVDALIARGGMAAVYSAHRADDQFQQRVAVKIMDLRLSEPALVEQFKAERQILAALEHPTLTRLLDGGVTPLGEPYLVMEYVQGRPIDRYCDDQQLDLTARVRLFIQVCGAVAFAHRNLVLHRDLKPSNILVTADGHPKVVDFGTATLLQPDRLSTISRAPLTPAYASPEQLVGAAVGTASDQYSLGLILYELLTGVAAFASRSSLMSAVERALAREEPTAPHAVLTEVATAPRRTSLSRLRRLLAGDLGTIVRKALAADAGARYASVEHMAEDLQRWLAGEPILGRAPSLVYRASRFVQRHWAAVAVAAALVVALLAATIVSVRQAGIARAESAKARELNRFLTNLLSSASPTWSNANAGGAPSLTVRQVLDTASESIGRDVIATPEVEAEIRRTLGAAYNSLGAADQALTHLERALALYRELGDQGGMARTTAILALNRGLRGDFKGQEALGRQTLEYTRANAADVEPQFLMGSIADLAVAIGYQRVGDPEAIALMREAIAIADQHGLFGSALIRQNLSIMLIRTGKPDEAEVLLREAQRQWDAQPSPSPERYSGMRNLAVLLYQRGEYVEAEQLAARAAGGYAQAMPANHPLQANFKIWWGRTLLATGQIDRARSVVQEAYGLYTKMRPAGHLELALPLIAVGSLNRAEGDLQASERALREARAILSKNPSSRDRAADAAGELGLTLRAMGRPAEADVLLKESYDTLRTIYGDAHPLTRQALARREGRSDL